MEFKCLYLFLVNALMVRKSGGTEFYSKPENHTVVVVGQTTSLVWTFPDLPLNRTSVTLQALGRTVDLLTCSQSSRKFTDVMGLDCFRNSGKVNLTLHPVTMHHAGSYWLSVTNGITKREFFKITVLSWKVKVYIGSGELVYQFPPDEGSQTKDIKDKAGLLDLSQITAEPGQELIYQIEIDECTDIKDVTCDKLVSNTQTQKRTFTNCSELLELHIFTLQKDVGQIYIECDIDVLGNKNMYIRQAIDVTPCVPQAVDVDPGENNTSTTIGLIFVCIVCAVLITFIIIQNRKKIDSFVRSKFPCRQLAPSLPDAPSTAEHVWYRQVSRNDNEPQEQPKSTEANSILSFRVEPFAPARYELPEYSMSLDFSQPAEDGGKTGIQDNNA